MLNFAGAEPAFLHPSSHEPNPSTRVVRTPGSGLGRGHSVRANRGGVGVDEAVPRLESRPQR